MLKMVVLLHADRAGEDLAQRSYLELAALAAQTGEAKEEIDLLNELIKGYPESVYATYGKGILALRADQKERAAQYLRQTLEDTDDAELRRRAEALLRNLN